MAVLLSVFLLRLSLLTLIVVSGRGVEKPATEIYLPDYRLYRNLDKIQSTIKMLHSENPLYVRVFHKFKSFKLRDIPVLVVKNYTDSAEKDRLKKRVLLVFGSHARELLPVESALHFVQSILDPISTTKYKSAAASLGFTSFLLSHFIVYVVPLLNPDGRERMETKQNLCWRGNYRGVDPERNFPWEWGGWGSSGDSVDEEFRGTKPLSEPESSSIRDLCDSVDHFHAAVSFHSGIQHIYLPYSDSQSIPLGRKPANYKALRQLANHMAESVSNQFTFKVGHMNELNGYTVDGTMVDYLSGVRAVPFALSVELWGKGDTGRTGCFDTFNPESGHLKHILVQLHPLYKSLFRFLAAQSRLATTSVKPMIARGNSQSRWIGRSAIGYVLLAVLLLVVALCKRRFAPYLKEIFCAGKRIVSLRSFGQRVNTMTSSKQI